MVWTQPSTQASSSRSLDSTWSEMSWRHRMNAIRWRHDISPQVLWARRERLGTRLVWTQKTYHKSVKSDCAIECSPEKDYLWWHWLTISSPWMEEIVNRQSVQRRDVIGCEDCKTWLLLFDQSFVRQMSVGLLLVKLFGLSIVCLSCDLTNDFYT